MGYRRKARELALQALFYLETDKSEKNESEKLLDLFCLNFEKLISDDSRTFFLMLVKGVKEHEAQLDTLLDDCSKNWKLSRMPAVDRNIMRIGVFELIKCPDIPSKVTINEALEIGKKFGSKESAPFINGVLDKIRTLKNIE